MTDMPTTRDAYQALPAWMRHQYSYEQAMANPSLSIALKNTATAMAKARQEARQQKGGTQ